MRCRRCNVWRHTADACSAAKEEAVLAVTSKVEVRVDEIDYGTAQASAFKADETGECDDDVSMGDKELVWRLGDERAGFEIVERLLT